MPASKTKNPKQDKKFKQHEKKFTFNAKLWNIKSFIKCVTVS